MKKSLEEIYAPGSFGKHGHKLVDQLTSYLEEIKKGSMDVLDWIEPGEQLSFWRDYHIDADDPSQFFSDFIQKSIHIHHPHYAGHQVGPPAPVTALADMLAALLNNGMAIYEMGSAASAMEKLIAELFCETIGFNDDSDGIMTSGGTLANLTGLLSARSAKAPGKVWEEGSDQQLAVMVSSQSHYCIERAVKIMGWGAQGMLPLPVNDHLAIDTEEMEEIYQDAVSNGTKVIAVVANACSTATGTYDDLEKIGSFCKQHGLWFHVDGAHGGAAIFSEKYKHLLKGIEMADSVVIDLHKMMMNPVLSTMLLFKNARHSYDTFKQKAEYLLDRTEENEWYNYAKRTFECTKLSMSLKFFTLWKMYGTQIFDDNVTSLFNLGREFASMVKERDNFELAVVPQANIVCFRFLDVVKSERSLNEINATIRQEILENGDFYIVQTQINQKTYLRTSLMNPFTTLSDLEKLLNTINRMGMEPR